MLSPGRRHRLTTTDAAWWVWSARQRWADEIRQAEEINLKSYRERILALLHQKGRWIADTVTGD